MTSALSREQLLTQVSKPLEGSKAMAPAAISAQLEALAGWSLKDGAIEKSYKFKDYYATLAFLNAVAFVVHKEDHHPDICYGYNAAQVRFNTHSVKGISINDFICASKCDALYDIRAS